MSTTTENKITATGSAKIKPHYKGTLVSGTSPFSQKEALNTIRTNLLFILAMSEHKTFAISSPLPSEGKTTICSNLAITLALTGSKVLLMDCDLRKPMIHRLFKLPDDKGITSILCGINEVEEAKYIGVSYNLDVITAGPLAPNPSELLGSSNMTELLNRVQKEYDFVILDTPPVNVVSDALLVAKQTTGLILISRLKQTRFDQLQKSIEKCKLAGVNILGMIVNDVSNSSFHNNYRYYNYYRYGYTAPKASNH